MKINFYILTLFLVTGFFCFSQKAILKGIVLDENNKPIEGVNISFQGVGTQTDATGFYVLTIDAEKELRITFSHVSHKPVTLVFKLKTNESFEYNPVMKTNVEQMSEVVITAETRDRVSGVVSISPNIIRKIPGANAGIENILKTLPGVNSNNDLSTQFSVRGGSFEENLVYVNEVEVYRPLLIRSGQQEGLSFVNTDLTESVYFSAGGFQAKYGDKMSSVLDITYRTPTQFGAGVDLSFLGATAFVQGVSRNQKLSGIAGFRLRDNSLLVDSQDTDSNFNPRFIDFQTFLTYQFNRKLQVDFLGVVSQNDYDFRPKRRQTNFGTITDPRALVVLFEGKEQDQYQTQFGAFKATYKANDNLTLKFITSAYHAIEEEFFDIEASFLIGEVNTNIGSPNLGEVGFGTAVGSQLTHARNELDALISNFEHKGTYTVVNNQFDWGIKYTVEDIRDKLDEFEIIDSAGFSVRPFRLEFANNQPDDPFTAPLVSFQRVKAKNDTQIDRISGFGQWSKRTFWRYSEVFYNVGARFHYWNVSGDGIENSNNIVISPRAQFSIKPNWISDMVFRLSAGLYHQPPFYRELRNLQGVVQPDVDAQQALSIVLGNDFSFLMWDRPFKLVSEVYYKDMTDVNAFTIENVRTRFRADNNTDAYAYGLDVRLNGEFVPGTESWFSLGLLKTEENTNNQGSISRPTDQRFKFAALFQDYVPNMPNLKMYLNLVYNTGLPTGSPAGADPRNFQNRLRDYKRADIGVSYVFTDGNNRYPKGHWLAPFKELTFGVELFNMFDTKNANTSTFVRDTSSNRFIGIPNFQTGRVASLRLSARF